MKSVRKRNVLSPCRRPWTAAQSVHGDRFDVTRYQPMARSGYMDYSVVRDVFEMRCPDEWSGKLEVERSDARTGLVNAATIRRTHRAPA